MALYMVNGQVLDDQKDEIPWEYTNWDPATGWQLSLPAGAYQIPTYNLPYQFGTPETGSTVQWQASMGGAVTGFDYGDPGYIDMILQWADRADRGELLDYEQWQWDELKSQAMAVPLRDTSKLYAAYGASEDDASGQNWLGFWSPDLGHFLLSTRDKIKRGEASPHERQVFDQVAQMGADWHYRASVPQESDAFSILGNDLLSAMSVLGMGASMGAAAPLFAGGAGLAATLGAAGSLAGTAGGITGMLGEATDQDWLRKAGIALGAAGGLTGATGLAAGGLHSIGDWLKLGQKVYGAGNKIYGLTQGAGSTPDDPSLAGLSGERLYSMDPAYQEGQLRSRTQALSAQDTRTQRQQGSSSSGAAGTAGGGMETYEAIGTLLSGVVGLAGSGFELADVARYMGQLKDKYGREEGIANLIDQAYNLAKQRYDQYYQQSQGQYGQEQEAYRKSVERADRYYEQTQGEQAQRQQAYQEGRAQILEDRAAARQFATDSVQRINASFDERMAKARQEYETQFNTYGVDRQKALESYNQRVAEAQQDRQRELSDWNTQLSRKYSREDVQEAQIAADRAMGMRGWEASYGIGANLANPAAIQAGAQQIYRPLSQLAVERISEEVSADRSLRGLTGGGQYGDYLAAKAYAPFENELWNTALNAYLTGQRGAIDAYGNRQLARSGDYSIARTPQFSGTPQYEYSPLPNFTDLPQYQMQQYPDLPRVSAQQVPETVRYLGEPQVPPATPYGRAPGIQTWTPEPYSAFGAGAGGGRGGASGGAGGAFGNLGSLIGLLARTVPGAIEQLFGGDGYIGDWSATPNPNSYSEPIGPGLGWDAGGYGYGGMYGLDTTQIGSEWYDGSLWELS